MKIENMKIQLLYTKIQLYLQTFKYLHLQVVYSNLLVFTKKIADFLYLLDKCLKLKKVNKMLGHQTNVYVTTISSISQA